MPSAPFFSNACETDNKTREICIPWLNFKGGNEINNYIVTWAIIRDNSNYSQTIVYNGMETNSYTIKNLQPGQVVNVSIRATNNAGEGKASWKVYATGRSFL